MRIVETEQGALESTSNNSSRSIRDVIRTILIPNLDCFDSESNALLNSTKSCLIASFSRGKILK